MNKRLILVVTSLSLAIVVGLFAGLAAAGAGTAGPNDPAPLERSAPSTRAAADETSQVQAAVVKGNGDLVRGSSGVTATKVTGFKGAYNVHFPRKVWSCVYSATLGQSGHAGVAPGGSITVAGDSGSDQGVFVQTRNSTGAKTDRDFHLVVACPE